ncbi:AsmA family protein [Bradyrhizobium sp. LHD-71]|uniref:AsmA family protein n=1 Tax=Bradyrhizobium sp. LHD-71 TaxID=3072141 RepID=UPI0035BE451E
MSITAFVAVALLAAGSVTLLLDRDAVRAAVEAQVRAATGMELTAGQTSVSLFPTPTVTYRDVRLGGPGEAVLSIQELTANLRMLALVLRRFEIADLVLTDPRITVRRGADGLSNWEPLIERLEGQSKAGVSAVSFSEVRIKNGILTYQDDVRGLSEVIADIDVSLAWPSISRSFAATGDFNWRGERIDGSMSIANFASALSGERSGLRARFSSAPVKIAFDGTITNRTNLALDGNLTVDSASLRDALRWAGHDLPAGAGFGRFSLKARANATETSIALANVNVELDGNVAEGVMSYGSNGRQTLHGTLAADTLDITPYISTIRMVTGGSRDWNRQPFDLSGLSGNDLDLRLSAARMTVGKTRIGRTALGLNVRDGALMLSVGEAQVFGGVAKGSFNVTRADANAGVRAQFQLLDVDLETCLGELFGMRRIAGKGTLGVTLEAVGANPFGLAQSLDGRATLTGRDGALTGFNVEQLLKRLERRPLSGAGDFRSGRTPFDTLNVALRLNDGIATTEDVRLDGPTVQLALTGAASIPSREFDLKGVATLVSAAGAARPFELPFVIQGPWDDPLILPDSESLLRRSPASAPLLDAVRDRRARDAVKSAIERLTGGQRSGTAPAEKSTE